MVIYDIMNMFIKIDRMDRMKNMKFDKETIQKYLHMAHSMGIQLLLVEENKQKGFSYPYLLWIPNNPNNILLMDCLNDYEESLPAGTRINQQAKEDIYNLFGKNRIKSKQQIEHSTKEEEEEKSYNRLIQRLGRAIETLGILYKDRFEFTPIVMPLIPGYFNDMLDNTPSELSRETAKELQLQITAIIQDAKDQIQLLKNKKMQDKIIAYGHSKSSSFANGFSLLHPEMCKSIMLGGTEFAGLPIENIQVMIVKEKETPNYFEMRNGAPTKKITEEEFQKIKKEYYHEKKEYQADITINENGTYNIPLNYPFGLADIEHYIDINQFANGKTEIQESFSNIPRIMFVGEKEEEIEGDFAYSSGTTIEGIKVEEGQNLHALMKKRKLYEIERASVHNRVLEYSLFHRILFGKSANERWNNYIQLCNILEIPSQFKIYKGVGHREIYRSQELKDDSKNYYESLLANQQFILNDNGRAKRIHPIYQLIRRFLVSETEEEYHSKEKMLEDTSISSLFDKIMNYLSNKESKKNQEMDLFYDELTTDELCRIFHYKKIEKREQLEDNLDRNGSYYKNLNFIIQQTLDNKSNDWKIRYLDQVVRLAMIIIENPLETCQREFLSQVPLESTIQLVSSFFNQLNPTFYNRFHSLLTEKNNYNNQEDYSIHFYRKQEGKNRSMVRNDGFVRIDYSNTLDDSFTLAHEITHKFSQPKNQDSMIKHFLGEVSTIAIEFLLEDYLRNFTNYDQEEIGIRKQNRIVSTYDDAGAVVFESILLKLYQEHHGITKEILLNYLDTLDRNSNIYYLLSTRGENYLNDIVTTGSFRFFERQRYVIGLLLASDIHKQIKKDPHYVEILIYLIDILGSTDLFFEKNLSLLKRLNISIMKNDTLNIGTQELMQLNESYKQELSSIAINDKKDTKKDL